MKSKLESKKILIIQTAFIGDVILATSLIEFIKKTSPECEIAFLLRDGNQSIVETNPHISKLFIWNKSKFKYLSLFKLILEIRKEKYDSVINIQRFFNSGLLTCFSGSKQTIGFDKNPLSFFFTKNIPHLIPHKTNDYHLHEVQRNLLLYSTLALPHDFKMPTSRELKPKIYFNKKDEDIIANLGLNSDYLVLAPSSVWFTKQWPLTKWQELIDLTKGRFKIILIGAPSDKIYLKTLENNDNVINLAGKLSLRQSALLMKNAQRVFVNDSAPLHLASSVNAKTTAIFCSTVEEFGYSPLSDDQKLISLNPRLSCMPCGLHGHNTCPKTHFKCAMSLSPQSVFQTIF